ncbi:hypothetical protein DVJ78_07425 [Humibacter sp. BT305]|nr:hypothetical protein DVJ78_07425 [Humibacter sp. BT305]
MRTAGHPAAVAEMAHWSPRQQLVRTGEHEWLMRDGADRIAIVRAVRMRGRVHFRAVTWAAESEGRHMLGYFPDLDSLAAIVWREWLIAHGRSTDLPPR